MARQKFAAIHPHPAAQECQTAWISSADVHSPPREQDPTSDLNQKVGVSQAAPGVGRLDHDRDHQEADGEDRDPTTGTEGTLDADAGGLHLVGD